MTQAHAAGGKIRLAIGLASGAVLATTSSASAMTIGGSVPYTEPGAGVISGVAGLLQLCVAGYAIRLNRLFGTARVGWSLFWAFFLLALLRLFQSANQMHAIAVFPGDLEVVYMFISLLLLVAMVHLQTVLKEQQQRAGVEKQMRDELESEVRKKTAHLNRAIEELQAEIDERRRAEARVQEQARLLDLAHDAIIVRDLSGRIQFWNKGAENIYGWSALEAVGKAFPELLSVEVPAYESAGRMVLEKGVWEGEASARTKAGQSLLVQATWTLVYDPQGSPKAIMGISSDITEKRKLETQTLRVQRLESIGALASGIAHDLNNVLTPLLMSVQLLKERATTNNEREILEILRANATRGARLVRQILTFGRGVKGDKTVVKPAQLAQDIKQFVLDTFPKSVAFEVEAPEDLWTVMGDATQLYQVLLNLCVNARDAMPNGGKLSLQMENLVLDESAAAGNPEAQPGPYVLVRVTDTGTGIPKAIQSRIFEPFFTTKEPGKGTGLGLSTSFTIAKNHGGFIACDSEPGHGSTFKVYLPACSSRTAKEPLPPPPARLPHGHGELVLVVDDEQVNREFARMALECFGYRVLAAANGAEAVSLYQTRQADIAVVFMDMAMPVMDGPAAITALKYLNPRVVIIGTSGLPFSGGKQVGECLVRFLPKPYSAEVLLDVLNQALHPSTASASSKLAGDLETPSKPSCLVVA